MINSLQWTDIEAIHYHLTLEFIPVLLDMVVLYHDYHHINILQEVFEIIKLILCYIMILQEWIITFNGLARCLSCASRSCKVGDSR